MFADASGYLQLAQMPQCCAQIDQKFWAIWEKRVGPLADVNSLFWPASFKEQVAESHPCVEIVWSSPHRSSYQFEALIPVAKLKGDKATVVQGFRIVGLCSEKPVINRYRIVQPALLMKKHSFTQQLDWR